MTTLSNPRSIDHFQSRLILTFLQLLGQQADEEFLQAVNTNCLSAPGRGEGFVLHDVSMSRHARGVGATLLSGVD
jgi:hypothetical protein